MALVLEDGTLVAGAQVVADATFWDAYWTARNRAADLVDGLADEAKEATLLYANSDLLLGKDWRGVLVDPQAQALPFPRYQLVDDERRVYTYPNSSSAEGSAVPLRLKQAVCEHGAAHLEEPLNEARDRGGAVQLEKVGPIVTSYFAGAPRGRTFPHVERLLAGLHDGEVAVGGSLAQELVRA